MPMAEEYLVKIWRGRNNRLSIGHTCLVGHLGLTTFHIKLILVDKYFLGVNGECILDNPTQK